MPRTLTFNEQISDYQGWQRRCLYVAGGLGGLILFGDLAKDSFSDAPSSVRAVFMTFAILAAGLIGYSYTRVAVSIDSLQRELERRNVALHAAAAAAIASGTGADAAKEAATAGAGDNEVPDRVVFKFPVSAVWTFGAGFVLLVISSVPLLVAAWWKYPQLVHWVVPFYNWLRGAMDLIAVIAVISLLVIVGLTLFNLRLVGSVRSAQFNAIHTGSGAWELYNNGGGIARNVKAYADGTLITGAEWAHFPGSGAMNTFTDASPAPGREIKVTWTGTAIRTKERKKTFTQT
ncbi:hypothetical protein [Rhodococcus sp. A14]|uniref:hypothetical protein n=1 Tax=Rhodococcus sp. A14 TaxID=1194106 RepID=UPI001421E85E|nr:hypothetical protein [Rhodococcus sp. A14]